MAVVGYMLIIFFILTSRFRTFAQADLLRLSLPATSSVSSCTSFDSGDTFMTIYIDRRQKIFCRPLRLCMAVLNLGRHYLM